MASYCEVCQGLYDIPHPHSRLQRSPLSPPLWKRGIWNPVCPSSSPPERGGSGGGRGSRGLSWPRVASRHRETPHALRSPFLEARSSGHDCVGPYVCPCQQQRSSSMPAVPDSYAASASHAASHSPPLGRRVSPGADGGAGCGDELDGRHRCTASLPPPMSAFAAAGRRGSPFIERYGEDTYCSQRRADGNPPQLDYLRRGAGHVCTYESPYDDCEGDGERIRLTPNGGDTAFPSSSFSPCAPVDAREAAARHHRCASAGIPLHVCRASPPFPCDDLGRGGEVGSRIPHHSSSSRSLENATRYASERDAPPRSSRDTSADHPSRRISPAVDGGGRRGTHMPSVHNDTGSGEPSSSQRPPLLPSVASMTPASSFAGLTLDAEQRAQASASFEAPLHFSRHGDSAWQPAVSAGPLLSRARDSLANLVAKIRAEVSKDVTSRATRAPSSDPPLSPADAKPRATEEGKRQRHRRAEKPQEQGYAPGTTSYAEQTSAAQATASSLLSSSAVSTGAEGTAAFHVLAARRSSSAGDNRGSHAYRPSAAPPAASRQAHSARSHRRRSSTAEYRRPSRPRHSASSSLSACSTHSSSSSVHLRHTVRRAEAVLGRLRDRSHGNGGSRAPSPAAKTSTRGFVGNSLADDAAAAGAATVHGRRNTSAHSSAHGKDCARLHSGRGHRRHSAPPVPSRPHATRVPSRRSSLPAPTDAFSTESPGAPQRVHPPDRAARKATRDVGQARDDASTAVQTAAEPRREQEMWRAAQEHRIERLREGLSALCAAVRKDLQKVREEVGRVRAEANGTAEDTQKRMREALATALRSNSPDERATHARRREVDFHPSSVVAAVTQCTPAEQRRLAMLLLPHFRPLLAEMVQGEVQCQLRQHRDEQQEAQHDLEQRLHTYVGEAVVSYPRRTHADETLGSEGIATAPLWATFSSADAFDAHLRSATRAVLLEEDDRRYSLANENERRHERRVQKLKQDWQETLKTAQAEWKAEWKAILEKEANAWTCRARAPLQQQADMLQDIVKALTRDVTHLQEQQEELSARLSTSLRHEREVRVQEQTQLTERAEQRVRQLLPREVELACVRFHALREQRLATAASRGTFTELTTPGASRRSATPTTCAAAAAAAPSSAEELRLSIVQPAMEHMRRLLVLHQEMIDATVEARCRRAEHTVEGNRHVWSQNVAELRSKLSALRADVRGALGELCENLNVASPAL